MFTLEERLDIWKAGILDYKKSIVYVKDWTYHITSHSRVNSDQNDLLVGAMVNCKCR